MDAYAYPFKKSIMTSIFKRDAILFLGKIVYGLDHPVINHKYISEDLDDGYD